MALGSVKEKLVGIERFGANMQFLHKQKQESQEGENENE
jgi:hypothetical protein